MANDNWGDRARVGMFIVGAEVVPEAEWWAMAPVGVSIHAARVTAPAPWARRRANGEAVDLAPDLERGARQFAAMALSSVVIAHTSSSIMGGPGWDDAVMRGLDALLPPDTAITTNGLDCTSALRHRGVRRPFIVFPPWFTDDAMRAGVAYFTGKGMRGLPPFRQVPEPRWADVPPEGLYRALMHIQQRSDLLHEQIVANCPPAADGVLIVGTGLRCVGIIDALETELQRPVVTANQASLWRCLGLAGVEAPVSGYGSLLAGSRESA